MIGPIPYSYTITLFQCNTFNYRYQTERFLSVGFSPPSLRETAVRETSITVSITIVLVMFHDLVWCDKSKDVF